MPRDNSNNLFDNSGNIITFNTKNKSNNDLSLYNPFADDDNDDSDPLEVWRREKLAFILKLLEEDSESPRKRLRSSSTDNNNMQDNPRSTKKPRNNALIEGLDNTSQPPPVINISNDEPLSIFLKICDKE